MTNRRELLKLLAAGGVLGPSAAAALQPTTEDARLTTEILERAAALLEAGIDPARIREILPAVQRNRNFFDAVRDLEIGDEVEPAPLFRARGK
jgi:hypothetical protein